MTPPSDLSDRQRRILARLVAEYIDQGEPISSTWLAGNSGLSLSSATVRNVLARLEEQGLVRQPHTSAGRVPTDSAYRLYVDWFLDTRKPGRGGADRGLSPRGLSEVAARLRGAGTVGDLLQNVSHELSRASHQIGFALAPASPAMRLEHIDFVNLEGTRVLVIVVATGGQITHKVIDTTERHDSRALTEAANYINSEFAGLTLIEARAAILERMQQERRLYDALMGRALELAQRGLDDVTPAETVFVQGASFLLEGLSEDLAEREESFNLARLRVLFRILEEKHRLINLLTQYLESNGLTVVIGSEHVSPDLKPFSLVAATFRDGDRTGTIGVIGPTRMRYQRAISVVESVSQAVTRVLESGN
jgi:heat-inducible transcriptional repressor